jgi:hypothetical protein
MAVQATEMTISVSFDLDGVPVCQLFPDDAGFLTSMGSGGSYHESLEAAFLLGATCCVQHVDPGDSDPRIQIKLRSSNGVMWLYLSPRSPGRDCPHASR